MTGKSFYTVDSRPVCSSCMGVSDDDGEEDDEEEDSS